MKIIPRVFVLAIVTLTAVSGLLCAAENAPAAEQGYTVTVDIKVNEAGKPESLAIAKSEDTTAGQVLDKMALAMAMKMEFPPHLKDGKAVKFTARSPFFFPIEGDEGPAANLAPQPKVKKNEHAIQPAYPLELAQRGEPGGAILELIIDAEGKITKLTTLRASHPEIEAAAIQAVKQWEFVPAMKDGQPVESRWRLAIVFESQDHMADLKWRIAPRPSLGSFIVVHDTRPLPPPEATPAPAPDAATPAPAAETPATPAK